MVVRRWGNVTGWCRKRGLCVVGKAGQVRWDSPSLRGKERKERGVTRRVCQQHLCICLPRSLSLSLFTGNFTNISTSYFQLGWNVQTFLHGLLSGPTETRWLLNQTRDNETHSNPCVPRGTDDFTWTLGMMGVPPEVTLQPPLSHTLGKASLLASRYQSRADHNEHQWQQIINFEPSRNNHRLKKLCLCVYCLGFVWWMVYRVDFLSLANSASLSSFSCFPFGETPFPTWS